MSKEVQTVYVRNVNKKDSAKELTEIFGKYGNVRDVHLPLDYYTREPRFVF